MERKTGIHYISLDIITASSLPLILSVYYLFILVMSMNMNFMNMTLFFG